MSGDWMCTTRRFIAGYSGMHSYLDKRCRSEAELQRIVASGQRDVQYKWQILRSQPSPEDRRAIALTIESRDTVVLQKSEDRLPARTKLQSKT